MRRTGSRKTQRQKGGTHFEVVGAEEAAGGGPGGAGAPGGGPSLRRTGPVYPSGDRGGGTVPGHPGGGASAGRGHLEAGAAVRRCEGVGGGPGGPGRAGGIFSEGEHRLGPAGHPGLFGPVSGRPVYLRPRAGGDRPHRGRAGHRSGSVCRPGAGGGQAGGQPPGL